MVKTRLIVLLLLLLPTSLLAQEVLVPASAVPVRQQRKVQQEPLRLPFFDDFSNYNGAPNPTLWDSGGAVVGTGFALFPPTVGMLSLDALDADGLLYSHASTSLFPADTATSLPIRLDLLGVADSVVLSFYYLPGGGSGNLWERMGDAPNQRDSLFVDFYYAGDWHTVWSRHGVSVDSLVAGTGHKWQYVALPLTDSLCFDSTFRFRFRNYCSLDDNGKTGIVSNADQWNVDYVLLDSGRSVAAEPEFRDVAFVSTAPSMLKRYRAMPARQYRTSDMASSLAMAITNIYSSPLATQYTYTVYDSDGNVVGQPYDGGYENAPPFLPTEAYQSAAAHAAPPVRVAFAEGSQYAEYTIVHTIREGTGGDMHGQNDTVRYTQTFANYYAYDDGTPENGFGLTSTASTMYLAYRFDLNVADTLTAVDLYFNPVLDAANEHIGFHLTVWQSEGGKPGSVLYRDQSRRIPRVASFVRYDLERPVPVSGSVFVGFEQEGNDFINLGFDRSFNTSNRIYYLTSTEWQQSILSGSLMMRPVLGAEPQVSLQEVDEPRMVVWPNPACSVVHIDGLPEGSAIVVYDQMGRRVCDVSSVRLLSVGGWSDGIYLLQAVMPSGKMFSTKLQIRH